MYKSSNYSTKQNHECTSVFIIDVFLEDTIEIVSLFFFHSLLTLFFSTLHPFILSLVFVFVCLFVCFSFLLCVFFSMSQQRQPHMVSGNNQDQYNDTTFTKIFVGGLAWETQRETMRMYFEQFGEILEAVVITDKYTGRSKGYGFVTFKDPEAAIRACQNPSPVIDGRRANCNIASLGANKNRSLTLQHGRFRPPHGVVPSVPYHGSSSTVFHQPTRQYTFPYSAYGYSGYSQDTLYPANYYSVYGVQQYSPYYPSVGAAGAMGLVQNMYPYYGQYAQNIHGHGFGVQYPQMTQIPVLPQHYGSQGILTLPSSVAIPTISTATVTATTTTTIAAPVAVTRVGTSQASGTDTEQQHSTS